MPISTNPNATSPFSLPCDAGIPQKDRPAFLVKFMSQEQLDEHERLMLAASQDPSDAGAWRKLIAAVKIGIVGWRNMKDAQGKEIAFSEQAYFDVLCDQERWNVAWHYPAVVRLTKVDLGFLDSPAPSAGAQAAAIR